MDRILQVQTHHFQKFNKVLGLLGGHIGTRLRQRRQRGKAVTMRFDVLHLPMKLVCIARALVAYRGKEHVSELLILSGHRQGKLLAKIKTLDKKTVVDGHNLVLSSHISPQE